MSNSAAVIEGVRRAATCAALLFGLNVPQAVIAQRPAVGSAAAPALTVDGSIAGTGLTLAAHHLDVRIAGGSASVQALLLLRNDTAALISAQYQLPKPARIVRGDAVDLFDRADPASLCDDADLSPGAAEHAETAPGRLVRQHDVIVVAPGEQISIEAEREVSVVAVGGVQRFQLSLPVDPAAPWVPHFTADVLVEADRPIRRLWSSTHRALVAGLGEHSALLSVEDGFVYRQTQLAVEFELDADEQRTPRLALDHAPAGRGR